MRELMKACSNRLAMWRGWRGIGLPRVYVGVCAGSRSVGRLWKRWIYIYKEFVRSVVVLSWLCIMCIKCMEPVF